MQITKKTSVDLLERLAAVDNSITGPIQKAPKVMTTDGPIDSSAELVIVTKGSAAAITLSAPTAGLQSAGGDDGKELAVLSTTAFAHTVTTPANKINGNKLTATFAAAVGNMVEFYAYNGIWYMRSQQGITLT
jgi:hypothetical protein